MERKQVLTRATWVVASALYAGAVLWLNALKSPWTAALVYGPIVLGIAMRSVAAARQHARHPLRQGSAPALGGLSELQSIYMGRTAPDELEVRPHDEVTTSLVVPYTDPLEQGTWVIAGK